MFDIKTLMLCNIFLCSFFCIAFFIYSLGQKTYPGFGHWIISTLLLVLAFLAVILRGPIPVGLSIFATNGLFALASIIRLDAVKRFMRDKKLNKLFYTIPVFVAVASSFFYFSVDRIEIRNLILSVVLLLFIIAISWELVRYSPVRNRLLYYSAGAFIAARGIPLLIRAILWHFADHKSLFDAGLSNSIHFSFDLVAEVGVNVIFLMMNSQRTEADLITSQTKLNFTVSELKKSLSEVRTLQGILPICSHCKQIRDDTGYWNMVEAYVEKHTEVQFSHSICPSCSKKHYPEEYKSIHKEENEQ